MNFPSYSYIKRTLVSRYTTYESWWFFVETPLFSTFVKGVSHLLALFSFTANLHESVVATLLFLRNTCKSHENPFAWPNSSNVPTRGKKSAKWRNLPHFLKRYRVFTWRVYNFLSSFSPFFYNINIAKNDFIYSKFCEDSEYAHFEKVKRS